MLKAKFLLLTCGALLCAACDSTSEPEPVLTVTVTSGADQVGGLAYPLPSAVVIRVADASGRPIANHRVVWNVASGGGRVDSTTTFTDAEGLARARWTLGSDAGTQLLVATAGSASLSVRARGEFQFVAVSAGFRHTCALSSTGDAYCWGWNASGVLGDGTETARATPTRVIGGKRFVAISAGWGHTCGLAPAGDVLCWGDNTEGQLGIGSTVSRAHAPLQVNSSAGFTSVSAGFVHTCAVALDGTAYCWGNNSQSQLGNGNTASARTPVQVSGAFKYTTISSGEFHTCAVATDGAAYCWGWNSTGELGVGAPFGETRNAPTRVANLSGVKAIAASVRHACAMAASLYCWGRNALGETGITPLHHDPVPHVVTTPASMRFLGGGNVSSCGADERAVYCWGSDGFTDSVTPRVKLSGTNITSLGVGFEHACAISAGDVYCWGSNSHGQLGRPGAASAEPVKVARPGL